MAVGIIACKKESTIKQISKFEYKVESKIPYSQIQLINKGFKGTQGSSQILVFANMDAFKLTLADLDRQVRELDSAFVSTYSSLSKDSLNLKEEEIGFNEKQPLLDFADFFMYHSLYMRIDSLENIWLNNTILDDANEPDNHFIFELALRAILNADCEVQIDDIIYKITGDGYFTTPSGNFKSLQLLDKDPTNTHLIKDVFYSGDDCSSCKATGCNSNKRQSGYKYNSAHDKRIKYVVSHWTHPWDRRCAAKTDNYKKNGWFWKKYRTNCFAKVYGYVSDMVGECDGQLNFNTANIGLNGYNVEHVEHKIEVQTKTKTGWVQSNFYGAGGISHDQILTWY